MECYSFSKPGADHLEAGQKGQDQMFGIHGADHLALCLCDGCGSSPLGGRSRTVHGHDDRAAVLLRIL